MGTPAGASAGTILGFAAADVHYPVAGGARAALVLAGERTFAAIAGERTVLVADVAPYRPGRFYERELPPLLAVLAGVTGIELLVVDGYVDLDPDGRPGLGAHVHAALGVPVVGVAKTRYASATHAVPVIRGAATRPLFVTAAGLPLPAAAGLVRDMSGPFRLPEALRRVDALARGARLARAR
jgi:deoxyribonuclease V